MSIRQWKAAVCQSEPCWFDKVAAIEKSIRLIREAKQNGASLIAFSEVWVPGYPNFLWSGNYAENLPLVQKYMANSISAYGDEMLQIRQAAAENKIYVSFGFSERAGHSLYLAQMFIGPDGNVLLHRRKTKPTHVERTIFGDSTGDSLKTVVETPLGRIGMLNCWEHLQPLLKYHTYAQGEQVHIAAWPSSGEYPGNHAPEPYSVFSEANEVTASRLYAIEGAVYVLCTNQPLSAEGARLNSEGQAGAKKDSFLLSSGCGAAAVFGPDGRQLTEPTDPTYDGLIYCDIDLDKIDVAKNLTDCVGHYSRPDLLRLVVDDQPKNYVTRVSDGSHTTPYHTPIGSTHLIDTHKTLEELLAKQPEEVILVGNKACDKERALNGVAVN
ncbi:Cyanide hydratase [Scedosporium apiospermum]|uniref:nitrilase n=1 Tax=Pseudallescheria apiosperma TaxID=563466 RepID=A0A084FYG0_PSEDA|nr:Cyanide hydratase [Scedosporium apiospermum]KEZ40122.1 Cyanide hydratase [Scedosporium apiospermum]